jgi:ribosomal protein L11 methyltransferase
MTWWAIEVDPGGGDSDELAAWLVQQTGQAVEQRSDGTVVTFAVDESAADRLAAAVQQHNSTAAVSRRALEAVDWTTRWRDGLGPRRFGRLTVAPSWSTPPADADRLVVLDPESAFGSGEHGSTRAALSLLETHLQPGDCVLDLGSGSGILSIAAVKLGAARAIGVEIDADANEVAVRNAERNGVAEQARFMAGDAALLAPLLGPVDLVLSNILRTVNVTLLPSIHSALRAGGLAIFSGMEATERSEFLPPLAAAGFDLIDEQADDNWWAAAARRSR